MDKLKRVENIRWDEVTRMYTPESEGQKFYSVWVDRSKEDKDVVVGRDCI